jgi:hypothetical protein
MLFQALDFWRWQRPHSVAFEIVFGGVLHDFHGSLFPAGIEGAGSASPGRQVAQNRSTPVGWTRKESQATETPPTAQRQGPKNQAQYSYAHEEGTAAHLSTEDHAHRH